MEQITDVKIAYTILNCLSNGNDSFVIYPYGVKGKLVKKILNEDFNIKELAIVDSKLFDGSGQILCLDDLQKISQSYVILLASDNKDIWQEIRENLNEGFSGKIIDIAVVKISGTDGRYSYIGRKMNIDSCSDEQVTRLFDRTQTIWKYFGEREPYWSVVTHDEFRIQNIKRGMIEKFYLQGWQEIVKIVSILKRNDMAENWSDLSNLDIVEIGCGCGRVTKGLAGLFHKVTAVDISRGNLEIARKAVPNDNAEFRLIERVSDYDSIPNADVVYSFIVLQHNCPPIIEYMVRLILHCLKLNGIAIFQVPTYRSGYKFEYNEYISEEIHTDCVEMHVLPQRRIFEIVYDSGCIPLEVHPDDSTGQADESRLFVIKKIRI